MKKAITNKKRGVVSLKDKNKPKTVVTEFETLFEQFPQLHNLLYDDFTSDSTTNDSHLQNESDLSINETRSQNESFTPRKKQHISSQLDNLPESEWVLKNQVPLEHQMFDNSIIDEMDTGILSSPSKRKARLDGNSIGNPNTYKLHDKIILENIFRFFGITSFPLVDPTDLRVNIETNKMEIGRSMIGMRLDIFDERSSTFEKPHYILLKKTNTSKDQEDKNNNSSKWFIFKHTIPEYLNIRKIMEEINQNGAKSYNDIYIFCKEVYIQLLETIERRRKFEELEYRGIISNLKNDLYSNRISFSVGGIKIQLYLDDNIITSCVILKGIKDSEIRAKWETVLNGPLEDLEFTLKQLS